MIAFPEDWKRHAACRGTSSKVFFPESAIEVPPAAAALCGRCPVIDVCRDWAILHEEFGVWAGLTEADRRKLRRTRRMVLESPHAGQLRATERDARRLA